MDKTKSLYKKIAQPKQLKRWRPSNEFINSLELCIETYGCDEDEDRATICRKALNAYSRNVFDYSPTDKKEEGKQRRASKQGKAQDSINLLIAHNVLYVENKLNITLDDSQIEGIVVAWIQNKLKTEPVKKRLAVTRDDLHYDDSY